MFRGEEKKTKTGGESLLACFCFNSLLYCIFFTDVWLYKAYIKEKEKREKN